MYKICVFCGSQNGFSDNYLKLADQLGELISSKNFALVYGGASIGVMGRIADAVMSRGAQVIGVIPEHFSDVEIAHQDLNELIITKDMHERKQKMYELSDEFLIIPGGLGTMDEFFEILTWSQIGLHNKTIRLLNYKNFYDPLITQINKMNSEGFVANEHIDLIHIVNNLTELEMVWS